MTPITVTFHNEQEVHRLLLLVHRDLCRVEGEIVIAERRLDRNTDPNMKQLPGRMRRKALQILETAPAQAEVLEGAQEALQDALKEARVEGLVG